MDKHEIASYLVNLQTIMEGQDRAAAGRGQTLADEYNKYFDKLLNQLKQEHENGSRSDQKLQQSDEA